MSSEWRKFLVDKLRRLKEAAGTTEGRLKLEIVLEQGMERYIIREGER